MELIRVTLIVALILSIGTGMLIVIFILIYLMREEMMLS
jgi:hypothetical protein